MDKILKTAVRWTDKLKTTTEMLNSLENDVKLPNGWGKRDLLLHLSGWDDEFIKFSEEMRKNVQFYAFYEEDGEAKNQQFFEETRELNLTEAIEKFNKIRQKLFEVYEEIIEKYPQDNKEFVGFFSIWWHDAHHLKQAGIDVSRLDE